MDENAGYSREVEALPLTMLIVTTVRAVVAGDIDTAGRALERLGREFGSVEAQEVVCRSWAAAAALAAGVSVQAGRVLRLEFVCPFDGRQVPLRELDPATVWAGRVYAAHVAADDVMLSALVASVPEGAGQRRAHLCALVGLAAERVRGRAGMVRVS